MRKLLFVVVLGAVAGAAACVSYAYDNKPEYMQSAETRVSSYLTSDYGRVSCKSNKTSDSRWEMECLSTAKAKSFQYAVYPAEQVPYTVARPFYLEALNEDARQSAREGLMRYLQINVNAQSHS